MVRHGLERNRTRDREAAGATRTGRQLCVSSAAGSCERRTFPRHHHLQRCAAALFRTAWFAAGRPFRKSSAAVSRPNVGATRQSRNFHAGRAQLRVSETRRPHSGCALERVADSESPVCAGTAAFAALLLLNRPRPPCAHDRAVRTPGPAAGSREEWVARAVHAAAAAELRPTGGVWRKD